MSGRRPQTASPANSTTTEEPRALSPRAGAGGTAPYHGHDRATESVGRVTPVLDAVEVVSGVRSGREHRFEVRTERLTEVARWMEGMAAWWASRLASIKRIAEKIPED
jgi:hypothetical protein